MDPNTTTANARSKRQRFYELMKTTKDVYIPTLSNTITQLASEATTKAMNYTEGIDSRDLGPNKNVQGAQLILYPHYTRHDPEKGSFFTQVHGWSFSTEGSQRKKRLILALARQLAKSNNATVSEMTAGQLDEHLNDINNNASDAESLASSTASNDQQPPSPTKPLRRSGTASSASSELSTASSSLNTELDDVLKERIASFVNRSLGNTELDVRVGGENKEDIVTLDPILTDANGNFNIDVETKFKPAFIQVALSLDEKTFAFKETIFPGTNKFGIISDIDDTIKNTGVCGDKRSIFRNVFADDMSTWEVAGAADCYRYFYQKFDMSFYYVSNSPYQLFSNLIKFFDLFEFPKGSMYLKRYTGNFLNSFMEASHTRKKQPLERICQHFGDKKFFLIGDTSEQDLEAYVDLARIYPQNVARIYLRVAHNSISTDTLKMVLDILNKRSEPITEDDQKTFQQNKFGNLHQSSENLIDLENVNTSSNTTKISKQHLAKLVEESQKKSEQIEGNLIDLEESSSAEDDFFPTLSSSEQRELKQQDRKEQSVSTPPSPQKKSGPPVIPKKPTALKSDPIHQQEEPVPVEQSKTAPSSAPPSTSTSGKSNKSDFTSNSNLQPSSAPPLPKRRPIPRAPPPRNSLREAPNTVPNFNSNPMTFDEELNDEWISRILTSLIILKQCGNGNQGIKLKLFMDFSEVQQDILNYIEENP